jgi:hypothetical protein
MQLLSVAKEVHSTFQEGSQETLATMSGMGLGMLLAHVNRGHKFGPFTLVSVIDWWSGGHPEHSEATDNGLLVISCVLPEIIDCKKTEKQLATKLKTQAIKVCFIWHKIFPTIALFDSFTVFHNLSCMFMTFAA